MRSRHTPSGSTPTAPSLSCPASERPELPGTLTEVTAAADDGQPVRSWLALPHGDTPAPLVLWVHGGPLASWNAWHWRWNPWLLVARGYAVLMPDPALSTGYGQDFIQRGWGAWGFAPYTDLIAATDAACAHPRVDETRTAAMGGSFGGYMANWIAGHTDRFDAIVTHASLWALDQFGPTTDGAYWWAREMTPRDGRTELATPLRRPDPHPDAGHPRRQGLSRADRRGAAAVVRAADRIRPARSRRRHQPAPIPLLPVGEPLGAQRRSTPRSGTRW